MKALIDGDIIRYSVGFASNEDPIEYCLHSVKQMVTSILDTVHADSYTLYLTGEGNFREDIATIAPYKGNRDVAHKPIHYEAIKEYMLSHMRTEVVVGKEADDALGIEQYRAWLWFKNNPEEIHRPIDHTTIICTIDKDLNMIPGWHYNWRKNMMYFVTEDEAIKFFYTQLLTGDPTDNIKGVPKIGPKRAEKILAECKTEEDMYWAALCQYEQHYDKPLEIMTEMARLLWIWRHEDDMWEPPY